MSPATRVVFTLVMVVAMSFVALSMAYLLQECGRTTDAVTAFTAAARSGRPLRPLRPSADADATTQLLATSVSVRVRNFIATSRDGVSQACVWTEVTLPNRQVNVDFFLRQQNDRWVVETLSSTRNCSCPEDDPCAMP